MSIFKKFALLSFAVILLISGCSSPSSEKIGSLTYPEFSDETQVSISGYSLDAMEPFISSNGNCLFFNSLNDSVNTSLYYATKTDDTTFVYAGQVSGVNGTSPHLDAVASMDSLNNFYFVSTRNYPTVLENLQTGSFNSGTATGITPVLGNFYISTAGWIIMDAEINRDGTKLYYTNAYFSGGALPAASKLGIADKQISSFLKSATSDSDLANINDTAYLVYAPCTSSDGKELYFTRIKIGNG